MLKLPFGNEEQKRLLNIKNTTHANESLSSYSALAELIADKPSADLTIKRAPHGKPYFPSIPLPFSISHSVSIAVVALNESQQGSIGADIEFEREGTSYLSIAKRYFTDEEYQSIRDSGNGYTKFLRIWTAKEAYSKMLGTPLAENIKNAVPSKNLRQFELALGNRKAYLSVCCDRPQFNNEDITILSKCKELDIHEYRKLQN